MSSGTPSPEGNGGKETLRGYNWRRTYSDENSNIVAEFLIPALERSIAYDRTAGFFGSSMLSVASRGITKLIANGGKMRLVASVKLTQEDVDAISKGLDEKRAVESALLRDQPKPEDFEGDSRLKALAWMVAAGKLEVKVAVPVKDGQPETGKEIFHSKVGIFTDSDGDRVSFSGSINETGNAWIGNNEEFKAFTSWEQPGYVQDDADYFEALWNGFTSRSKVYQFPEAIKQKLISYAPSEPPLREPEEIEQKPTDMRSLVLLNFVRDAPFLSNSDALSDAFLPFLPRLYQLAVADAVVSSYPRRFLLADEVGLGKTIETGLALRRLFENGRARRCLILTPASILRQWQEHLRDKFGLNFYRYDGQALVDVYGSEVKVPSERPFDSVNLILASTALVSRSSRQQQILEALPWDIIVLDEAHHARRQSLLMFGTGVRDRGEPNLLLRLMQKLESRTTGLLLLTATPMQLNVIELYDLLKLLGMKGLWAADDELFERFYSELSAGDFGVDSMLLFDMAREYIQSNGLDREYDEWVKSELGPHSWSRVKRVLVDADEPVKETERLSKEERSYLRGYITRSTPLHSLMFRNTRAILEDYRRMGLGSDTFPKRKVEDVFVVFETKEERQLYDEIEEYVTRFYRIAEDRHALILKLVMQMLRRRLTSSFEAVRKSLRKRLDAIQRGEVNIAAGLQEDEDAEEYGFGDIESEDYARELANQEAEYLRGFLDRLDELGGSDSKMKQFQKRLRGVLLSHERVLVFTQYTDTMDYVRDQLVSIYGSSVGCYSGRGGEFYDAEERRWVTGPKSKVEQALRTGELKILIGTEAMGEGLDLQSASVVMNYDVPWNPMKVEQRIGRVDRIGQKSPEIGVINFFYENTIEAYIYRVVDRRHKMFQAVVGEAPGILAAVNKAIQEGVMIEPDQREKWLEAKSRDLERQYEEFKRHKLVSDEMTRRDRPQSADLRDKPPVTPAQLKDILTSAAPTKKLFAEVNDGVYRLSRKSRGSALVTFNLERRSEQIAYMNYYSPVLREVLEDVLEQSLPREVGVVRVSAGPQSTSSRNTVAYFCKLKGDANPREVTTVEQLITLLDTPGKLEPLEEAAIAKAQKVVDDRAREEARKEQDMLQKYREGLEERIRASCRILVDRIVAVQIALKNSQALTLERADVAELVEQGRQELTRLVEQRLYSVPALVNAAKIQLPEYALPVYTLSEYIGQGTKILEGTLGQLVQQAFGQLERFKLSQEVKPKTSSV